MPIYFIRHGQSEFNASFDPALGDSLIFDAPLSALGRQQALEARQHVSGLGIERVITSPLTRAIQTALSIFDNGPAIEIDARPRELLLHSCDVGCPPDKLASDFPDLSFDHIDDNWWYQGEQNEHGVAVEPRSVFEGRAKEFRNWLIAQPNQIIAVVGHGNFFNALIGRKMENCEIHTFEDTGTEIYPNEQYA